MPEGEIGPCCTTRWTVSAFLMPTASAPWMLSQLVSRPVLETATAEPTVTGVSPPPCCANLKPISSQTDFDALANTCSALSPPSADGRLNSDRAGALTGASPEPHEPASSAVSPAAVLR